MSQLENGKGFYYVHTGNYEQASLQYNKALQILRSVTNYPEADEAKLLNNLAASYIY